MQKFLILFFLLLSQIALCQRRLNEYNERETQYLRILLQTTSYLKGHSTNTLTFHESETYTNEETFYDTVITKFFAKEKMLKLFEDDTSHFAVAGKLDITRHVLNSCDYYLDIVPSDSILVEPGRYFLKYSLNNDDKQDILFLNSLHIFFKVGDKKIKMLVCHFDEETNKVLTFSLGSMTKEESEEINIFLKRQKGYYEFPNPLN